MKRAVVIQHVAHEGPGWLAEILDEAGLTLDVRRMYDGASIAAAVDADAIVVMGGPMSAYDDATVPWLASVKELLSAAVDRGTPVLGICLGAQLLAVATGGVVKPGEHGPEIGLGELTLCDAAGADPLLRSMVLDPDTVQWHWDCIDRLPDGATLLASSPAYTNQAFRVGERAWGFQFHPEVTLPLVAQWAQDDAAEVRAAGMDPIAVVGAVADAERMLLETWTPALERFAALSARQEQASHQD
jgi:GMP synthase-like glutamine amidotransferase